MKKNIVRHVVLTLLMVVVSCDEPDTVVTNIVHPDGSVTRKIVMRSTKTKIGKFDLQVPFDSSWSVTDSIEVGVRGDTTWIKRAEKVFTDINEINSTYKNDTSSNGKFPRHASFSKKFRWFNTSYRFSEILDKRMSSGHSLSNFLNDDELLYFYSPDYLKFSKLHGSDSLKYKSLADTIDKKNMNWTIRNFVTLWIEDFSGLIVGRAGTELSAASLKGREGEIVDILNQSVEDFDSLWSAGVLLKKIIGETDALKFKTEADSAVTLATNFLLIDYKNYSVRIVMPGKLTGTNGFIDSTRNLVWPVNADLFFTDRYEMWAESKTTNLWAWIVSGVFLAFVLAGILLKKLIPPVGRD